MPTQRLSMRRIKQLLTMRFGAGASTREMRAREINGTPPRAGGRRRYDGNAVRAGNPAVSHRRPNRRRSNPRARARPGRPGRDDHPQDPRIK